MKLTQLPTAISLISSQGEELIYKGKVNALNSSHRDQPSHVCGLTFPDCVAKKFWEQKRIHYEVEIERNPPKKVVKKKSSHHETKDSNRKSINNTTASEVCIILCVLCMHIFVSNHEI